MPPACHGSEIAWNPKAAIDHLREIRELVRLDYLVHDTKTGPTGRVTRRRNPATAAATTTATEKIDWIAILVARAAINVDPLDRGPWISFEPELRSCTVFELHRYDG